LTLLELSFKDHPELPVDQPVPLELPVPLEPQALQEQLGLQVQRALYRVQPVHKVRLDRQVLQEQREQRARFLGLQDQPEQREMLEQLDRQVLQDRPEPQALQVQRVLSMQPEPIK